MVAHLSDNDVTADACINEIYGDIVEERDKELRARRSGSSREYLMSGMSGRNGNSGNAF